MESIWQDTLGNRDFMLALGQIIWINILLSGDNAVVIALACRGLPPRERRIGIILGAGAAVVLRVIFTLIVNTLLGVPYLKLIGGLLLLWIAVKLLIQDEAHGDKVTEGTNVWEAVKTVAIADIVMSLDNVLAIAAAARGNVILIILGLLISIPLIIGGATLLTSILQRYPILVWAGAALLGWIAGELIVSDVAVAPYVHALTASLGFPDRLDLKMPLWIPGLGSPKVLSGPPFDLLMQILAASFVVAVGWMLRRGNRHSSA